MKNMKKPILLIGILLSTLTVHARGRLGVQVSPGLSFNGMHTTVRYEGYTPWGVGVRLKVGALYDYVFLKDYCVSTGLYYLNQRIGLKNVNANPSKEEIYALQYFQIPLLVKLYTPELVLDTRCYVSLGAAIQIKAGVRNTRLHGQQKQPSIESFSRWNAVGLLAAGVEYDLFPLMSVFGGISYQHGISNVIDSQFKGLSQYSLVGYGHFLSIDLGIRF